MKSSGPPSLWKADSGTQISTKNASVSLWQGNTGGLSIYGGTANTDNLVFRAYSATFDPTKGGRIALADYISIGTNYTETAAFAARSLMRASPTVTGTAGVGFGGVVGFWYDPTFSYDTGGTFLNIGPAFYANPQIAPTAAITDGTQWAGFTAVPNWIPNNVTATITRLYGFQGAPTINSTGGSGVANVTTISGFYTWEDPIFGQNFAGTGTITDAVHYLCGVPSKSGNVTVTNQTGLKIPNWTVGTNIYGVRSAITAGSTKWFLFDSGGAQSSLTGKMLLSGTATPTEALSFSGQANRAIWMERHTTSNTAGNSLRVEAGSATSAASDKAGGDLIQRTGLGTGNGGRSKVFVYAPSLNSSATTADQTFVERIVINGTGTLATAVAKTLVTPTVAAGQMAGGHLVYTVDATDGTDQIAASGQVAYSIVNKAGTYTGATSVIGTEAQAKSDATDTITNTWAFGAASSALQITSTIVGMTAGTHRITYAVISNAGQTITVA